MASINFNVIKENMIDLIEDIYTDITLVIAKIVLSFKNAYKWLVLWSVITYPDWVWWFYWNRYVPFMTKYFKHNIDNLQITVMAPLFHKHIYKIKTAIYMGCMKNYDGDNIFYIHDLEYICSNLNIPTIIMFSYKVNNNPRILSIDLEEKLYTRTPIIDIWESIKFKQIEL
jgi:hypothetical protein